MYGSAEPTSNRITRLALSSEADVVIVGAGLAGLFTALKLVPMPVTIIAAAPVGAGASSVWAQGGVAAAIAEDDSPAAHARDTIAVGAGLVLPDVARITAEEAPEHILDLLEYGVPFDKDLAGRLKLSREAAHSERRIVRVRGDRAGAAIMQALSAAVKEAPSIRILERTEARELVCEDGNVIGVRIALAGASGSSPLETIPARAVVLSTGGIGQLYRPTTNPRQARGEGLAMAARAGAVVADAEFVQFHPTALDTGADPAPLATEALRGDGAILVNGRGERFMLAVHEDAELAPRDVVARTVHREVSAGRGAFLDCRAAIGDKFERLFPTVYEKCMEAGIDPAREKIPVAPAAHYHMGGLLVDVRGRTTLDGLWACGEVASSGLHGANRLASNSLLEAVVFGARIAKDIAGLTRLRRHATIPLPDAPAASPATDRLPEREALAELRALMARDVGVVRSAEGLANAHARIADLAVAARPDRVLSAMLLAARFIVVAALRREESRGAHFRSDHPVCEPALAKRSFLTLGDVRSFSPADTGAEPHRDGRNIALLRP